MARSCSRLAHDIKVVDGRIDSHTYTHSVLDLDVAEESTKLTKAVATKVSPEVYDGILAKAHCDEVTVSCAVRRLLMRALAEDAGNLAGIDSGEARRRR